MAKSKPSIAPDAMIEGMSITELKIYARMRGWELSWGPGTLTKMLDAPEDVQKAYMRWRDLH